jgi:hypothetical protein
LCKKCEEGFSEKKLDEIFMGCRKNSGETDPDPDPEPIVTVCAEGKFWDRPKHIEGAKCVEKTANCGEGF